MKIETVILIVICLIIIGGTILYAWGVVRDAPVIKKFCEDHGGKMIERDKCGILNQDGAYTLYNINYDYDKQGYVLTR